ncbi:carboxylate--amine ligase [uncultured Adlercreutzia sp.]|uniref:carboxylate--amine ligase n=1 Tax=uncultured Adlercreutzia sp. TaxID=875803 RepID=UPI0025FF8024|nr:carboxylate--amine ligase [uncultured Adlercreutzia sp.]
MDTTSEFLPVILGGDIGAYSLARAFHEEYGVVSLVVSQRSSHLCGDSTILVNQVVPGIEDRETLRATLLDIAETHGHRPLLLLACGDWYVRMIVEMRGDLEGAYLIPYIDEGLLNKLVLKDSFYALCAEVGVPVPHTVVYRTADDPSALALPFDFPVVAKPASSAAYHYADFPEKRKVFFCDNRVELERVLNAVRGSTYDGAFLVQERIPGNDTTMRILTTYSDRTGRVRFAAFGQTLLEDPRPFGVGNPLAIVSRTDETVVAEATRLLEAVGYTGFANFDIKVDPRDGSHRFLEINTRLGRSNFYVTAAGHNVAKWLVEDLVQQRSFAGPCTVARGRESLYAVAPKPTVLAAIHEESLRAEVRDLYEFGCDADPLAYSAERRLRRKLYPYWFAIKQWRALRPYLKKARCPAHAAPGASPSWGADAVLGAAL